jgi:ATP-dependent RNA helicase DeaD
VNETEPGPRFVDLGLPESVLQVLTNVGYESPSPIQAATIPPLLAGRDVIGQAQTGTGKTAAFALPTLSRIDPTLMKVQALVLAPTRELAIQVSEAFQRYAAGTPQFHVLPIYGGSSYGKQLTALKRGVHVVVGTPGRVVDHLTRGTLDLSALKFLVLDEADEMLRMGFIDDVEAVITKCPDERQVALFSATMPPPIRRIARTYLRDPVEIAIAAKTTTAANTRQRFVPVSHAHKLDALTRIIEAEPFDAMIIFARTKIATAELAEKLVARGIAAMAINGDLDQVQRERTIHRLRDGDLDVLVATDVAARGLDVDRIGRTGRAGRDGEAILFVTPRERGMLVSIERATRQPIERMSLPNADQVNEARITRFFDRITEALQRPDLSVFEELLGRYEVERNVPAIEIAAALAGLAHGEEPLLVDEPPPPPPDHRPRERGPRPETRERAPRGGPPRTGRPAPDGTPMETFRIEVGHAHGAKPGNIVGAIANEAELNSKHIGRIDLRELYSLVDLPEGMPPALMQHLGKVRVAGKPLKIRLATPADMKPSPGPGKPFRGATHRTRR